MSKLKEVLNEVIKLGYYIDKDGTMYNPKGKVIKGCVSSKANPYLKVGLRILDYSSFSLRFHKLQAFQKYGNKIFEEGIVVRHKNGDSLDNSWDNILIGTQTDNLMDIPTAVRKRMGKNSKKHDHKKIVKDYENGLSYSELMERYNISSKGTIHYIIKKADVA
jgi:hypothetical protein